MINIEDTAPFKLLFEKDINGRIINLYKYTNVCSYGKGFYPNCFFKNNDVIINFSTEKIMSLSNIKYEKILNNNINYDFIKNPVFYFVYNTDNYYHFVYDTLPYLISFFELRKEIPNLKLLMNYPNFSKKVLYRFVIEFLELLGITIKDILILDENIIYEEVYVSSSYTHGINSNLPPRKEIYDFYKNIVNKAKEIKQIENLPKKIYISRRTWLHNDISNIGTNYTNRRKLECENELVEFLNNEGYVEIFTEKLTTIEKILLFNNVDTVIGTIGGGLCNVLFSNENCNLISINSPTFMDINNRFKYCFTKVNTLFYEDTFHIEDTFWKKHMRIKSGNIIGEIEEVKNDELVILYCDNAVAGWNSEIDYKKITINQNNCVALDNGLNSNWNIDISKFKKWIKY